MPVWQKHVQIFFKVQGVLMRDNSQLSVKVGYRDYHFKIWTLSFLHAKLQSSIFHRDVLMTHGIVIVGVRCFLQIRWYLLYYRYISVFLHLHIPPEGDITPFGNPDLHMQEILWTVRVRLTSRLKLNILICSVVSLYRRTNLRFFL